MFWGTVTFRAVFPGNTVSFDRFEYRPRDSADIQRIELSSPHTSGEITVIVHFEAVASQERAIRLATPLVESILDRIAFQHQVAIEKANRPVAALTPINPQPNTAYLQGSEIVLTGGTLAARVGLGAAAVNALRAQLEAGTLTASPMYVLFRTALLTSSEVEKFLLLYHILLALRPNAQGHDSQREVDAFIRHTEAGVALSPDPRDPTRMETVYTRLRNEMAHRRPGVNLDTTRNEMSAHVGGLTTLAKRAIELYA